MTVWNRSSELQRSMALFEIQLALAASLIGLLGRSQLTVAPARAL
ncbi:hypothetical protein RMSM_07819 [Rhodopirellula maiorica SM1]|uniref:Uncharacterized protein n=1 Tax=Rhodopirellula maiorica SM1 TaxID=1265738 RepID=M5R6Y9_9BACT|nr:hypothetical protein RMSM_07819 [Rhodopirellula maiorica SM1]